MFNRVPKCSICKKNRINKRNPFELVMDTADGERKLRLCDECAEYVLMYVPKPVEDDL